MHTVIAAHRGDSSLHRENTLTAIESAIDHGAAIIEVDIRESKDGEIILLHDRGLERLWGNPADASTLTFNEISELGFGSVRIPTLKGALDLFMKADSAIMIDMESDKSALAALAVVRSSGIAFDRVIWCGDLLAMRAIREVADDARIWLPWNKPELVEAALISEIKPEFINSHYSFWNSEKVSAVHELGLKCSAWTIDDAPSMRWAKTIGIDSITTNQRPLLQTVLADSSDIDPLDITRAAEMSLSIAKWALMICEMMNPGKVLTKTNPADLVTEVDLFIELHAREMILANFPTHHIVGEEFGGELDLTRPTWYIDPVDGTTNFANHTPWSSFSLALAIGRDPMVAVTIDPWRNKIFSAVKNQGAFINGLPMKIADDQESDTPLIGRVVLTELAGSRPWDGFGDFLEKLHENFCTMRIMGAGTLTLTAVAANYGVGAVVHHFNPIDHLAAALIGQEAGCIVLNESGKVDLFPAAGGMLIVQPAARAALYKVWSDAITHS